MILSISETDLLWRETITPLAPLDLFKTRLKGPNPHINPFESFLKAFQKSYALNSHTCRSPALAKATNSSSSDCFTVENPHAVLARFCALNSPIRLIVLCNPLKGLVGGLSPSKRESGEFVLEISFGKLTENVSKNQFKTSKKSP